MRQALTSLAVLATTFGVTLSDTHAQTTAFRPPSVPLVTHDPYLSIWSNADKLTDGSTRHWTNSEMRLTGLLRVDGETFRVIGNSPKSAPALNQMSTRVFPTRTVCTFENAKVKLTLTFITPTLPTDLVLMSTPITYVHWEVVSADAQPHDVVAFFGASADLARHESHQTVKTVPAVAGAKTAIVKIGTTQQPVLERSGDATRIDWGYACLGGNDAGVKVSDGTEHGLIESFSKDGNLATGGDGTPGLGATLSFGSVSNTPVSRHVLLGYDDEKSIEWMGEWLNGYWKKEGTTIEAAFDRAEEQFAAVKQRCETFDDELMKSMTAVGGEKYALLAALAHRQSFAATKIVEDTNGAPLMFSKENNSNGCMGTVDIFFPQSPHFLLFNNDLAKASAIPVLKYASSPRWKWPYAPHDLGVYPRGNGQVYGGGERTEDGQMPVEESGNMLLILGGIAKSDGNADFVKPYWPLLTKWAKYLEEHGVDPANQLSTDDFSGHLARNANLSVKAILGMASYAMLADMLGEKEASRHYTEFARASAKRWMQMADAGDHYALAFDRPDTWSQKYNLVWDDILNLDIFPKEVVEKELAYYKTKMNPFGLPLDSRKAYTKSDWLVWTATLADDRATFDEYINGLYRFANETQRRTPFPDWYWTDTSRVEGFTARPVIGGLFMPMLKDEKVWRTWSKKATPLTNVQWAELPVPPTLHTVVPTSQEEPQQWRYTFEKPVEDWMKPEFADSGWKQGPGGFGGGGAPGASVKTTWETADIWIRREFTMPATTGDGELALFAHHDEDMEVYLDGKPFAQATGHTGQYGIVKLTPEKQALLTPGKHTFAVHCHQTGGGQYIDVGVVRVEPRKPTQKP